RPPHTDATGRGVADNAVVTVTGTDRAIGGIETGFVTPTSPFSIEIQGTTGSLQYGLGAEGGMSVDVGNGPVAVEVPADAANPFAQWAASTAPAEAPPGTARLAKPRPILFLAATLAPPGLDPDLAPYPPSLVPSEPPWPPPPCPPPSASASWAAAASPPLI